MTRSLSCWCGLLVCLLLPVVGRAQEQEPDTSPLPPTLTVKMRYEPPRIIAPLVRVRINGGEPENFILDTGASGPLLLTEAYVRQAKLPRIEEGVEVNDAIRLPQAEVQSMEIVAEEGDVRFAGLNRAVIVDMPLGAVAPGENVAGIIGIKLLARAPAQLDFKQQILTLYTSSATVTPPKVPALPLADNGGGTYNIPLTLAPKVQGVFLIDTGAYSSQVDQVLLDKLPKIRSETTLSGMVEGLYLTERAEVRDVTIAGTTERDVVFGGVPAVLGLGTRSSLIGMSLLQNFRLTFDIPNRRFYMEPNPVPRFRAPHGRSGATLMADGENFQVVRVEPKSPAATAGLLVGDRVLSVDGTAVTGESVGAADRLLEGYAGTEAQVEILRGTKQTKRFTRTASFQPKDKFLPCFDGIIGRVLVGKPLEVFRIKPDAPLYKRGVRAGEQVTHVNSKDLSQQKLEAVVELLRVRQAVLIVKGKNGKPRTVPVAPALVTEKGK